MTTKHTKNKPDATCEAIKSLQTTSIELLTSSKALLQAPFHTPPSSTTKPASASLDGIATLAGLLHSHTVRTALTCGPTASSSTATLACLKQFHEPILPLVSEMQAISQGQYPEYFTTELSRRVSGLFETMILFLREIVEIVTGESTVDSQERLTCSGMMMQECDRIQQLCKESPMVLLRKKLELTEEMLKDAMDELEEIVDPTSIPFTPDEDDDDEWPRDDSPEQKEFAIRTQKVLKLLSLLYKAILKRRVTIKTGYTKSMLTKLDGIYVALEELNVAVDELVSEINLGDKEPMTLELQLIHVVDEAQRLSKAVREPLDGGRDTQVEWFDMWGKKMKES